MSTNPQQPAKVEAIEKRIDKEIASGMSLVTTEQGSSAIIPRTATEAMEMAKIVAVADVGIRKDFRGNTGVCFALVSAAARFGMDVFALASKVYVVNDQLAYEAQLCHAIVNTRAPLARRLRPEYTGEGLSRRCKVIGYLHGDPDPFEYESPPLGEIKPQNSPLWKNDPDQQLWYFSVRSWARRHVPEVMLGVYSKDEIEAGLAHYGPENAIDITETRPVSASFDDPMPAGPTVTDIEEEPAPPPPAATEFFVLTRPDPEPDVEFESAAEFTDALVASLKDDTWDFEDVWGMNEEGITDLEANHREGCYEPLFAEYDALVKLRAEKAAPEPEPEPESAGVVTIPSIILEESDAGVKDWKKFAKDFKEALPKIESQEALKELMELHMPTIDQMYASGNKASANSVKRAVAARKEELAA